MLWLLQYVGLLQKCRSPWNGASNLWAPEDVLIIWSLPRVCFSPTVKIYLPRDWWLTAKLNSLKLAVCFVGLLKERPLFCWPCNAFSGTGHPSITIHHFYARSGSESRQAYHRIVHFCPPFPSSRECFNIPSWGSARMHHSSFAVVTFRLNICTKLKWTDVDKGSFNATFVLLVTFQWLSSLLMPLYLANHQPDLCLVLLKVSPC